MIRREVIPFSERVEKIFFVHVRDTLDKGMESNFVERNLFFREFLFLIFFLGRVWCVYQFALPAAEGQVTSWVHVGNHVLKFHGNVGFLQSCSFLTVHCILFCLVLLRRLRLSVQDARQFLASRTEISTGLKFLWNWRHFLRRLVKNDFILSAAVPRNLITPIYNTKLSLTSNYNFVIIHNETILLLIIFG